MVIFPSALALILAAASGTAFAARWTAIDTGLPATSPGVLALAIDPATPSTLYALTRGEVIFKSTDSGLSWRPSNGIVGAFLLAIGPGKPSTIFAATRHGVVKSTDGGESWTSANSGLPPYPYSLAVNPIDSTMLYAVTSAGIFKTVNAGESWTAVDSSSGAFISGPLVIDPITPSTIFAPQSSRGLVKSTDGGETWTALHPVYNTDYSITSVAVDPVNPATIYAVFVPQVFIPGGGSPTGGVFKSMDGGQTWRAFQTGIPSTYFVTALTIDPETTSTIYGVITSNDGGGIVRSTDGGQSWSGMNDGLPGDFRGPLAIDPADPSILYAGGVFKSTQGGANWKRSDTGLAGVDASALAIDPVNMATVYAGVGDGVFRKIDAGANWTKLVAFEIHNSFSLFPGGTPLSPPAPVYPRSLAIDFHNPSVLYAWTSRSNGCVVFDNLLFKSSDAGASWNDAASPPKNPCVTEGFLVMDPSDPNTLYVVESDVFDGSYWVRKSVDAGANWNDVWYSEEFGPNALLIDPADSGILYAGMGGGLFKSADGGASWNNIALKGANVTALALDPAGILYAATAGANYNEPQGFRGLFKSADGGVTWAAADSGLAGVTGVGAVVTSLVVAASNRNILYAGTSGDGVYKSLDGGVNWLKFNDGLSNLQIRALVQADFLYAATAGGIFKLVD